jgi:BirA family biotin operon repressor/biotin-[acetyl-CoA-carboxylase] ligase
MAERASDARLRQIVRVLVEHSTVVVSGTKMSQQIGTSRSAVWRMVQQLRGYGIAIEGHPTTGYLLKQVPDLPLPEILEPLIKGTMFSGQLHHSFKVDSTNAQALAAAAAGAPEGSVFLAEEQTAGRGRAGHSWHSEKNSGIYCSIVLRPALAPSQVLALSLAAGIAVQEALETATGIRPDLRWPNDVLIGEKKVAGVLAEMNAEPTRVRHVVVGFGINVNQTEFPGELKGLATSLRLQRGADAAPITRVELVARLLQSLDREYRALADIPSVIARFCERSSYCKGKYVSVDEQGGYEGTTAGLDELGFLRIRTADGVRTVLSGTVRPLKHS